MANFLIAISNLIRGLAGLTIAVLLAVGGWLGVQAYNNHFALDQEVKKKTAEIAEKAATIERLDKEVAEKNKRIQQLDMANRLLKVDVRLAEILVLKQWTSEATKKAMTQFQFVEIDSQGHPLGKPKVFTIEGDIVHIDGYIVKYFDKFVEAGDPLKGTSAFLFRRAYGEHQDPAEGFPIDSENSAPAAYQRGSKMSDLEADVWKNFWDYANNPGKAQKAGIRAAHGQANYIKLEPGKLYRIQLRASDGLSIVAEELPAGGAIKAL